MAINKAKDVKYKNKEWLRGKCENPRLAILDIAEMCGVSDATIGYWMDKFGLESKRTVKFDCEYCGKECERAFNRFVRRGDNPKFCGESCQNKWQSENLVGEKAGGWNGGKVKVECEICGKNKKITPAKEKYYDKHFCSFDCKSVWRSNNLKGENGYNWKGGRVEKKCVECGEKYKVKESKKENSKFCSQKCLYDNKNEKVKVKCRNCGEPLKVPPSRYKNNQSFSCSWECRWKWRSENIRGEDHWTYKGGWDAEGSRYYGPSWNKKRKKTLTKHDNKCLNCGISNQEHKEKYGFGLHIDHIKPAVDFIVNGQFQEQRANKLDNLQPLCCVCHPKVEREKQ